VTGLSAVELLAAAADAKGLDDFGPATFLDGLEVLIGAAEAEAGLGDAGRERLAAMIRTRLENRLDLYDWHARHPEIAEEEISSPTFVIGLWRTGTTILSYLLAQDPERRSLRRWEATFPCPPPGVDLDADRRRAERLERQIARQHEEMPELATINIQEADGPTECVLTLSHEFKSLLFDCSLHIPSFYDWNRRTDQVSAYEHHRATLQLLQWKQPPNRWQLKAPAHTLALDALVRVYPDARFIVVHRDPAVSLASACHFWELQMESFTEAVDLHAVGANWLRIYADAMGDLADFRDRHDPAALVDLQYAELRRPLGAVAKVYDRFGLPFTADADARMRGFLAGHQPGRNGPHRYTLERYGLDRGAVAERFRPYCDRFGVTVVP